MQAPNVIARVFCVDGPIRGIQFLDQTTGRVLSDETGPCYYRVDDAQLIATDFGPCLAAYYDHTGDDEPS